MREGHTLGGLVVWAHYPPGHHPSLDALPPDCDTDEAARGAPSETMDGCGEPRSRELAFEPHVELAAAR